MVAGFLLPSAGRMDLLTRFVGEANGRVEADAAEVDLCELVMRLLLSDTVILKTHRLLECKDLLNAFGAQGLTKLLESEKLRFTCETFSLAFKYPVGASDEHHFQFLTVWEAERAAYVGRAVERVRLLPIPEAETAAEQIAKHIEAPPTEDTSRVVLSALRKHLNDGAHIVKAGIAKAASNASGGVIDPQSIELSINQQGPSRYRIRTNLTDLSSMSNVECRDAIGRGVLAVAGIYDRFEEMRRHRALSVARDDDLPLFDAYLDFLQTPLDPRQSVQQFRRLVSLTGVPEVSAGTQIDASRLIAVATSSECLEFRQLVRAAVGQSDEELQKRLASLVTRLGVQVTGNVGKGLRWVASTLTFLLPDGGAISGPAVGALDSFVFDKVIKPGGPAVFLNRLYPSIFK